MEEAMADIEDDADFGSHFLDSMLEVEMTEEDNELDVSKNDDPLGTLPPVPTFDLQSETLSYKEVFKNSMPQPVLATIPVPTSTTPSVPMVLKPSSMLIYRSEVQPVKTKSVLAPIKKIPRPNAKIITPKSVNVSVGVNNTPAVEIPKEKFSEEVFRAAFVKDVFVRADPPSDLAVVSEEEMKYYKFCFKDVTRVQNCRLHCTICDKHLGCAVTVEKRINVHKMLKVLTCKPCFEFYGDGNFPCDKGDNCEIYCRWCGQGGALVCCSFCPRVFCKKCVRRNYGPAFLKKIERASDWACFCCAQKPLWPHRAICRALLEFIAQKKTEPKALHRDTSSCCKAAGITRKKTHIVAEKNKILASQQPLKPPPPQQQKQQQQQLLLPPPPLLKVGSATTVSIVKNKTLTSLKSKKDQFLLKPVVQLKPSDKVKIPVNTNANSKPSRTTNIFSPKSIIGGNKIIRGIAKSSTKLFSSFPCPQFIQTPVLHGETLITPPSRFLVRANPPPVTSTPVTEPPLVKVSLTHQAPNLNMNRIPTVKIPQGVHGLILRLVFPDNKIEYIRLASDGDSSKGFAMPHFKEHGASFIEENLAEAFKVSKMLYDKLMRIRDKVNSRTKFTEESVFNSSVKKLHVAYEKTMELFKELDGTLMENYEEWMNDAKNPVDVIDISDDDASETKKNKPNKYFSIREKCKKFSDDSEVEIIEDVVINGTTPSNGNYKERYRLRNSLDQKTPAPVRKRKRGRVRAFSKKPKVSKLQNGQTEEDSPKTKLIAKNVKTASEFSLEEETLLDELEHKEKSEKFEETADDVNHSKEGEAEGDDDNDDDDGDARKETSLGSGEVEETPVESADVEETSFELGDMEESHVESGDMEGSHVESGDMERSYVGSSDLEGTPVGSSDVEGTPVGSSDVEGTPLESGDMEGSYVGSGDMGGSHIV